MAKFKQVRTYSYHFEKKVEKGFGENKLSIFMKQQLLHHIYSNSFFTISRDISKHLTLALNIICIYSFNIISQRHHFKDISQFRSLSIVTNRKVPGFQFNMSVMNT